MSIHTEPNISADPPGAAGDPPQAEDLRARVTLADPFRMTYSYDAEGRLVGVVEHKGSTINYTYVRPPGVSRAGYATVSETHEVRPHEPKELIEMDVPARVLAVALGISDEAGEPLSEVVRKGIALYRIALDARKDGRKVAIVDGDWQVDREITGF